jgi:tetratricopeptide (TPR) repeat protein
VILAGVQAQQGRLEEAWRSAEQADEQWRGRGASRPLRGLHLVRGDVLARLGRAREAEQEFRAEIAAFPALLPAYSHLAMLYVSAGRSDVGRDVLRRMIEISGDSPAAYVEAARTLQAAGDAGGADALLRRGRALHPHDERLIPPPGQSGN